MVSEAAIPLDVMAVGAHPDDIEIGCGGTLAALARRGYAVGIVDLTDGEPTPGSPGPDVRLEEARRAAEVLGIAVRHTLNLPNRRLFDCFEARVALATLFRRHRPRLVIGLAGRTVMASPDHYQTMLITDAAVFYSRLTKWDEYFDGLPVHTVRSQLSIPLSFQAHMQEVPDAPGRVIADISETLEVKMESVRCYATQFQHRTDIYQRLEALNRSLGTPAGFAAGELFYTHRPVGTHDLLAFADPEAPAR